ncbi:hypothetical protein P7K49_013666 [Saguinus oedipus]|uniref:Uncharacterized protein n=1 Tax=Saguinus oedipus TaxID=9490 RepID=A0ABQ9VH51_SAGOE|nr:hypothetical protein P7K49_013666 [Saguinus oedipus]
MAGPHSSSGFIVDPGSDGLHSTLCRDWIPSHLEIHWGQDVPFNNPLPAQQTANLLETIPVLCCMAPVVVCWCLHHETLRNDALSYREPHKAHQPAPLPEAEAQDIDLPASIPQLCVAIAVQTALC